MQFKPKKSLGQNFLKDENILKLIVEKADINKNDNVISNNSQNFPGLKTFKKIEKSWQVEFENIWYGEIAMTPTHLPGVHQLDRNLFTSIGYNGRGITTGTIFGKALADMISGDSPDCLPLPITQIAKVSNGPAMSTIYKSIFSTNQILKSFFN